MKKHYVAVLLGLTISAALMNGCSSDTNSDYVGETIYGQVSKVNKDSITIEIGTQKEMEKPEEGTEGESADGERPSMIDLTGEEEKITISDDTVIKNQSMGGGPGGMGGQKPDGEAPGSEAGEMPERPDDDTTGGEAGEMPEKPDGDTTGGEAGEMPEKPDGEATGNEAGEAARGGMPEADSQEIEISDISEGDIVSITFDDDGKAEEILVMSMNGQGQSAGVESYDAVNEYTEDTEVKGETVSSTGTDENAVHVYKGAEVSFKDMKVTRESDDSDGGDNSSFYGVGAAVLNTEGTTYFSDSEITTDAAGAAGIFAYGEGVVYGR